MVEIRKDILSKLKCSMCEDYLSCAPILTKSDGNSICGRCPKPGEETTVRNTAYEDLARMTRFPCINKPAGCDKTIPFNSVANHEQHCLHAKFSCPIEPVHMCAWSGKRQSFYQHCKAKHPTHIYENATRIQHSITKDSCRNMVMLFCGLLFLVQCKVSVARAKIWHCVRYIGNMAVASQFSFEMRIECDEKLVTESKPVATQSRLIIDEKSSIGTSINSLLTLLGTFKNVYFSVIVSKRLDEQLLRLVTCARCQKYAKEDIYCSETGCICYNCNLEHEAKDEYLMDISTQLFYPCNYKMSGCQFVDVMSSVVRHENFFCNFSKCLLCSRSVSGSKTDHYERQHAKLISKTMKITHAKLAIKEFQYSILDNDESFFICGCGKQDGTFIFFASSQLPTELLDLYRCRIVVTNPKNGLTLKKSAPLRRENRYDCMIYISEFEKYLSNQKYDIVVEIVKNKI